MFNWQTKQNWEDAYDESFDKAITAATSFAHGKSLEALKSTLQDTKATPASNGGLIIRILRALIFLKYPSEGADSESLVMRDAPKILSDLNKSQFTEFDANLLAAVFIRALSANEKMMRRTAKVRKKFVGVKFQTALVHPMIRDFAIASDREIAAVFSSANPAYQSSKRSPDR